MKNNFFIIFFSILFFQNLFAENISIVAKNISFEKDKDITIFEKDVVVKTQGKTIKSEYAKYNKKDGILVVRDKIIVLDNQNNKIEAKYAEYYEANQTLITRGKTKVTTSEKYILNGEDIIINNKDKIINSEKKSILEDNENNKILLDNFEYLTKENLFKSIGFIKIEDKNKNIYEFSQIYIDTKKKEILGTDTKTYTHKLSYATFDLGIGYKF